MTVVRLTREQSRSHRLQEGEAEALLAACGPDLRPIVEAALETGMRRGEISSLKWQHIEGMAIDADGNVTWRPRAEIVLPAGNTRLGGRATSR